ncbi:MAG: GMC family oxidoreductase [Cyanobacteria bacterium REEB459]|nr:GMC family oxidoreductase [Cyanobacteria bacterium REEB459]
MLVNSRDLSEGHIVKTDVCIIGSGPSGITLARELANSSSHVTLLESGGLFQDPAIQDLSEGKIVGDDFLSLKETRNRQFGGNSNVWSIKLDRSENRHWQMGVRYVPLDDIDFQQRDWVPYSGWPIGREDLLPYYGKAQQLAHSGPFVYEAQAWSDKQVKPIEWAGNNFTTKVYQFGPRQVFCQDYLEELSHSQKVDIYLYATAVELELRPNSQIIKRVQCTNSTGKTYWVEARLFVIATGGIETAKLMLASNQSHPSGIGNENDLVGRFFMDHVLLDIGNLYPASVELFSQLAFYDKRQVNGYSVMGHLALKEEVMAQNQLMNSTVILFPRPNLRQTKAMVAFKALVEQGYLKKPLPQNWPLIAKKFLQVAGGLDHIVTAAYLGKRYDQSPWPGFGRGGWAEQPHTHGRFKRFEVLLQTEQAPDPANRVVLSQDRDALGIPRAELHWRWGQLNIDSARRIQDLFSDVVEKTGLGHFSAARREGQPYLPGPAGMAHHIGTTRMSATPQTGVVNSDCRVHSVPNLYIASSSVFPTGGYANPTLTILALSLRLADHLKQNLG